jgi:hypothetical protein
MVDRNVEIPEDKRIRITFRIGRIRDNLPYQFEDRGEKSVKNIVLRFALTR